MWQAGYTRRLNPSHGLFWGMTNLWLPLAPLSGGLRFWDVRGGGNHGFLAGATKPSWRATPFGPGVQTGVNAVNSYIDLNAISLSRSCSLFVAYAYRYDASASGSNTETGILYSAGHSVGNAGISFRQNGTNLELLRSHLTSVVSGAVTAPAAGELHTAGFTITSGATATFTLYFDGKSVATAASTATFDTTGTTTFGYDSDNSNPEYGRHTILGGALWVGRVVAAQDAAAWHEAARQEFRPLFRRRPRLPQVVAAEPGGVRRLRVRVPRAAPKQPRPWYGW